MNEWTKVADDTLRLEVPGGWIYRTTVMPYEGGAISVSLAFVPSAHHHNDLLALVEHLQEKVTRLEVQLRHHEKQGLCVVTETLRKAWDGATDEQHGLLEKLAESLGIEVQR